MSCNRGRAEEFCLLPLCGAVISPPESKKTRPNVSLRLFLSMPTDPYPYLCDLRVGVQEKDLVGAISVIVKLHSSRRFVSSSIRHTSPIIQICSRFPLHSPDIVAAHWAGPRSTPQQNFYWGHNLYKSQVWFMSQLVRMLSPSLVTELLLGNLQCPIFNFKLSSGLTISSCSCSWPVSGCHLERKLQCNNSQFLYQTS